jgi:hypothetical protein
MAGPLKNATKPKIKTDILKAIFNISNNQNMATSPNANVLYTQLFNYTISHFVNQSPRHEPTLKT